MEDIFDFLSWYRRIAYNQKKRSWRTAKHFRISLKKTEHRLKICLCFVIAAEAAVLNVREPELPKRLAGAVFRIECESEALLETDSRAAASPESGAPAAAGSPAIDSPASGISKAYAPTLEGKSSLEKTDSGVTIDFKKGTIEFWKKGETIQPENGS